MAARRLLLRCGELSVETGCPSAARRVVVMAASKVVMAACMAEKEARISAALLGEPERGFGEADLGEGNER